MGAGAVGQGLLRNVVKKLRRKLRDAGSNPQVHRHRTVGGVSVGGGGGGGDLSRAIIPG